ncbi:MAG: accessory Sec system protein Asp3 [Ligilactobacillus sp.]|nr:accessory Sec system protein Asp3 [Ligilactobacillus sp.]
MTKNFIKWDNFANSFLYGSKVMVNQEGEVDFENRFLPAGTVLNTWHQSSPYQANRQLVQLPYLKKGHRYQIISEMEVHPAAGFCLRLNFYNQQNEQFDFLMAEKSETTFIYPEEAASYEVQLVATGGEKLHFKRIEIADLGLSLGKKAYSFSPVFNPSENPQAVNVVFTEPGLNYQAVLPYEGVLEHLHDGVVVDSSLQDADFYLGRTVRDKLTELAQKYSQLNLIGYGPISNRAAAHYQILFANSQKYLVGTTQLNSRQEAKYQELSEVKLILDYQAQVSPTRLATHELALTEKLLESWPLLLELPMFKEAKNG